MPEITVNCLLSGDGLQETILHAVRKVTGFTYQKGNGCGASGLKVRLSPPYCHPNAVGKAQAPSLARHLTIFRVRAIWVRKGDTKKLLRTLNLVFGRRWSGG